MDPTWVALSLTLEAAEVERASDLLETLGAQAVSWQDAGDIPILEPLPESTPLWPTVTITGLFSAEACSEQCRTLKEAFPHAALKTHTLSSLSWQTPPSFTPMRFGKRLWVVPSDMPFSLTPEEVMLTLTPSLAFGTGSHPTTRLCLQWLEAEALSTQVIIDYGCGSGILAIASLLLGAKQALAVDYDPQALWSTQQNALRNGIAPERLLPFLPQALPPIQVPILLANILAEPLIALAPQFYKHCAPHGSLVLSGILECQIEQVQAAYTFGFDFKAPQLEGEWALLHGYKRDS